MLLLSLHQLVFKVVRGHQRRSYKPLAQKSRALVAASQTENVSTSVSNLQYRQVGLMLRGKTAAESTVRRPNQTSSTLVADLVYDRHLVCVCV